MSVEWGRCYHVIQVKIGDVIKQSGGCMGCQAQLCRCWFMQKRAEKGADIPRLQAREPEVTPLMQRHSTALEMTYRV